MVPETISQSTENIDASLELIGTSAEIKAVKYSIHRIAKLNVPVLITGGSGTGKGSIARAIHNYSDRSAEPFIVVTCRGIKETLRFESEVFGDEINGEEPQPGLFQLAGKGTLLLDEIGELSLHTQVRVLRVLEHRTFFPIGSNHPVTMHARLIFTTNMDLKAMVSLERFRADLFYRINVAVIESPVSQAAVHSW